MILHTMGHQIANVFRTSCLPMLGGCNPDQASNPADLFRLTLRDNAHQYDEMSEAIMAWFT